ncbi:hypothetical protein K469DRAFT_258610 [Zopfia rhizophila CBS 207.26]|uniref:Uncharacterized protein n=1 Tax=Zopfia rhizophila CBS 207.26 TaxID=1314779 RepID=A0A6A6DS36_9PEZI|nr:hypothetical protein K469DRAFT_258610 [Zopfia rhizophila CBS 207.26]
MRLTRLRQPSFFLRSLPKSRYHRNISIFPIMNEGRMDYAPVEPLPPYSTTWGDDIVKDDKVNGRKGQVSWFRTFDSLKQRTAPLIRTNSPFLRTKVWPIVKKAKPTKKQSVAFLLLFCFGILPFILVGRFSDSTSWLDVERPFYEIFAAKVISCGDAFGTPKNSTITGIEGLFVLDLTFGSFPFSQAKLIDVAWDLFIGRGCQLIAWLISYTVFSDALLRVIERHPASYQTFTHIALEGPSLASTWALLKDLFRTRSKRTWTLFAYMLLSIVYVLSMPTVLSAMTGYVNTSIGWVDVEDSNEQIIPAANFKAGWFVYSAGNVTLNSTCSASDQIQQWAVLESERDDYCDCMLPNGTVLPIRTWRLRHPGNISRYYRDGYNFTSCNPHFSNNTKTFENYYDKKTHNCKLFSLPRLILADMLAGNATFNITISGHDYNVDTLNYTKGFCNNNKGYTYLELTGRSRCLPDTANPSYKWGFSTMLSGVVIIVNFIWALTMYTVWQDAQFNSTLVKSGYAMTQLRAAFTLATAARAKTGMEDRELLRAETKSLEKELFGTRKKEQAQVDYDIFRGSASDEELDEDGSGLRKRRDFVNEEVRN